MNEYIQSIRNGAKREYACRYWDYLMMRGEEPQPVKELSFMAAQAVRIELRQALERINEQERNAERKKQLIETLTII